MIKALITTVPFAERNKLPIELLENSNIDYTINPLNRKLSENELFKMIGNYEVLIAGTETISSKVLENASNLKLISRVGIGVDSIDLNAAKKNNILLTYTPDAPAPAVAELTFGLMFSLLRSIHLSNTLMHKGHWKRIFGRRIPEITIGIIGAGRIGSRVIRRLTPFGTPRILVNDINADINQSSISPNLKLEWVDKETIYKSSDLITLHVPKTKLTNNMITKKELNMMKDDAMLINTSRGGIINENDLIVALEKGKFSGVAIDVFDQEPYKGSLSKFDRCLLTSHMGSMSIDCRSKMEIEAVEEVVRYANGVNLKRPVPETEYIIQELK